MYHRWEALFEAEEWLFCSWGGWLGGGASTPLTCVFSWSVVGNCLFHSASLNLKYHYFWCFLMHLVKNFVQAIEHFHVITTMFWRIHSLAFVNSIIFYYKIRKITYFFREWQHKNDYCQNGLIQLVY